MSVFCYGESSSTRTQEETMTTYAAPKGRCNVTRFNPRKGLHPGDVLYLNFRPLEEPPYAMWAKDFLEEVAEGDKFFRAKRLVEVGLADEYAWFGETTLPQEWVGLVNDMLASCGMNGDALTLVIVDIETQVEALVTYLKQRNAQMPTWVIGNGSSKMVYKVRRTPCIRASVELMHLLRERGVPSMYICFSGQLAMDGLAKAEVAPLYTPGHCEAVRLIEHPGARPEPNQPFSVIGTQRVSAGGHRGSDFVAILDGNPSFQAIQVHKAGVTNLDVDLIYESVAAVSKRTFIDESGESLIDITCAEAMMFDHRTWAIQFHPDLSAIFTFIILWKRRQVYRNEGQMITEILDELIDMAEKDAAGERDQEEQLFAIGFARKVVFPHVLRLLRERGLITTRAVLEAMNTVDESVHWFTESGK